MSKRTVIVCAGRVVSALPITETDLLSVERARSQVVAAREMLKAAELVCAEREADIMARLEAGVKIARGSALSAGISEELGPRRPEWKEIYLDHMENEHGKVRGVEEALILGTTAAKPKQVLRIFHTSKGRLS